MSCTHSSLDLLPGKSEEIYDRYFNLLKTTCQQRQLQFTPQIFFTDFETATRNSTQRAFTHATLKSCFFHYTQCIWRKTQKLGLATTNRDNDNLQLFVRRAAVLPLVSPELFEDVWFNVLEDRRDCHQHDSFCRLCYRVLGRRKQPSAMEPLRQRGSTYQQPPREMAQQVKEAPQPRTPQHLLLNRSSPENTR